METSCQKFGFDLLKSIITEQKDQNVIYSPMSIYFALGMTMCGAHGETLEEMMKTLHWKSNEYHKEIIELMVDFNQGDSESGLIKIANKLFLDHNFTLLDSFKGIIKQGYDGGIDLVDFHVHFDKERLDINTWVEKQTNGKIKDLLTPGTVHALTKLILVNAIYFKGSWQNAFNVHGKHDFYLLNNSTKAVDMINKSSFYSYLDNKTLGFRAVQIPFKRIGSNDYSMMIILPYERCSLLKLETEIFKNEWHSVFSKDLFEHKTVNITMPKFRIESSFKLKKVLQSLGMVLSFSDNADFSLMTGMKDLIIDDVVHKAFIVVDEHGVEAAAATAVMMMLRCAPRSIIDPIEFKCDHPFMFALLKDGGLPLFLGHLVDC